MLVTVQFMDALGIDPGRMYEIEVSPILARKRVSSDRVTMPVNVSTQAKVGISEQADAVLTELLGIINSLIDPSRKCFGNKCRGVFPAVRRQIKPARRTVLKIVLARRVVARKESFKFPVKFKSDAGLKPDSVGFQTIFLTQAVPQL